MPDLGILGLEFGKNSTLEFVQLQNFVKKWKCLNLGTKMPYFGAFGQQCVKTIVIFEISTLEFVWLHNFARKKNTLNLGAKMPYLGLFGQ